MIEFLNSNGESVPLKEYTYDDPMAPSWHEFSSENIDFDGYMKKLLTKWEFPLFDNPSSKTFDQAFQDFLVSSQHPDQWSTRGWLMQGPAAECVLPTRLPKDTTTANFLTAHLNLHGRIWTPRESNRLTRKWKQAAQESNASC